MQQKSISSFRIYSFYRFVNIQDKVITKKLVDIYIKNFFVRGTILIADEGINGSISGTEDDLESTIMYLKHILKIRKLNLKKNYTDFLPFNKIKVRLKKEIVSLGKSNIKGSTGNFIEPVEWDEFIKKEKMVLIDLRNKYEIAIGKFKNAINPNTNSFREFPKKFLKMKFSKNNKIGIYCTGGIRCEKAAKYLSSSGFNNIYQLKGGILNYLECTKKNYKKSKWTGECFVFDNRVTVDNKLNKGNYIQCYGCRRPLKISETKLKSYIKGRSCKYCIKTRSNSQKKRSATRQFQIDKAEKKGVSHPFKKISLDYF